MRIVNKVIKSAFKSAGFDLNRTSKKPHPLVHHNIELLFDVGANSGQYAALMRTQGYRGRIVSFEPLPDAYQALLEKSQSDPLWTVHKRCAIGAAPGELEINIANNSTSSSLLPMLQAHSSAAPYSTYIGKAKTDVITLDSVFASYRKNNEKTYLKIDTQGFETEVLDGLASNLQNIFAIQLELSIVQLYDGQNLYKYFFKFFEENGFILWSLIPGFSNQETGQLLQFDGVFVRHT